MKTRIIHSKAGVSTTERITVRILIHFLPIAVAIHRSMQVHLHIQRIAIILIRWQERNSKCSSRFLTSDNTVVESNPAVLCVGCFFQIQEKNPCHRCIFLYYLSYRQPSVHRRS